MPAQNFGLKITDNYETPNIPIILSVLSVNHKNAISFDPLRLALLLVASLAYAPKVQADDGCNEIYRIAMQIAQVQNQAQFRERTREYLKSTEGSKSSGGGTVGYAGFELGVKASDELQKSLEKARSGDVDEWASLLCERRIRCSRSKALQ